MDLWPVREKWSYFNEFTPPTSAEVVDPVSDSDLSTPPTAPHQTTTRSNPQKLELTWIGKQNRPKLEPRILLEDPAKSYHANARVTDRDIFDNVLIKGDNLLALKALEAEFAGRVKCIYIDPPYNTGYCFKDYDDCVQHSLWLGLLRDRLEGLRGLLKPDGVIVVQIGFDEMAYLKVLLDEVFGRDHCIGQVAVRMSHSAGMKRQAADRRLIKNTEYLLFYFREENPVLVPQFEPVTAYPVNYWQWIDEVPTAVAPGSFSSLAQHLYREFPALFQSRRLKATNDAVVSLFADEAEVRQYVLANCGRIGRKDSNTPRIAELPSLRTNEFIELNQSNRTYYVGGSEAATWQMYTLSDKVREVTMMGDDGIARRERALGNLIGDWWDGFWRDMSRVDIEGGVDMPQSKKPERLIQWVLDMVTEPGDWVLDSFLGSGTTAAVAHKLGRRWIGVELGDHCETLALPRLQRVIDGDDHTGVTRAVNWQGGGGFRYYNLAQSLLKRDKWGQWVINKDQFKPEQLAEAVCKLEGFRYAPSAHTFWLHGQSTERDFIYVTTATLSEGQLKEIADDVGPERSWSCAAALGPAMPTNLPI